MDNQQLKSNLLSTPRWIRLIFMVLFAVALQVAGTVMYVVVVVQFIISLVTGSCNKALRSFGSSLSKFIYQTLQFLTYNSEEKPFPFADWPESDEVAAELKDEPVKASEAPVANKKPVEITTVEAAEAEDFIQQEDA